MLYLIINIPLGHNILEQSAPPHSAPLQTHLPLIQKPLPLQLPGHADIVYSARKPSRT